MWRVAKCPFNMTAIKYNWPLSQYGVSPNSLSMWRSAKFSYHLRSLYQCGVQLNSLSNQCGVLLDSQSFVAFR